MRTAAAAALISALVVGFADVAAEIADLGGAFLGRVVSIVAMAIFERRYAGQLEAVLPLYNRCEKPTIV